MDKLRSLREMQPLSDRHKIAQVVQIQFLIPPDLSILFELLTIDEFDHLAVTAGESLDLGEVARVDLGKARRFFEVRFWGAVTAAKYAAKRIKSTGSVILTNGIIGLRPQKGWVIAAGVCGALEAVTRALAIELA